MLSSYTRSITYTVPVSPASACSSSSTCALPKSNTLIATISLCRSDRSRSAAVRTLATSSADPSVIITTTVRLPVTYPDPPTNISPDITSSVFALDDDRLFCFSPRITASTVAPSRHTLRSSTTRGAPLFSTTPTLSSTQRMHQYESTVAPRHSKSTSNQPSKKAYTIHGMYTQHRTRHTACQVTRSVGRAQDAM